MVSVLFHLPVTRVVLLAMDAAASWPNTLTSWLLTAVGAVLVGLASAWVISLFGPKKKDQKRYQPLDRKHIDEAIKQARPVGAPEAMEVDFRQAVELGHFKQWVLTNGTTHQDYTRKIGGVTWRLTPSANYKDGSGRTCRKLSSTKRVQGHWTGTEKMYCLVEGQWQ
ncbi:MAG: hypothetical protein ACUZ8A_05990 [Candidatus Bathyanammoxibius sp.]